MKLSLRWLSELIQLPSDDPREVASVLANLGVGVEDIRHLGVEFSGVVTAKVEEVMPHPDADKVRVCSVTAGDQPLQVVCGAWNFEAGAVVAFANPGAVLSGGFEIGVRDIRGVTSHGMICSERELGLGDDHTGILVLDPDTPIGVDLAELVERPDTVLDLEITPNRPDLMSVLGIARELAAYYQLPLQPPHPQVAEVPEQTKATVRIDDPTGCLRFVAREVRGVEVRPSPFWMRQRLRAAGVRAISNVVDVTNYVMLELGQPLHAFDLDKVADGAIIVRRAREGERLVTLDGVERRLGSDDLVVADPEGASALAGTMGGEHSEVSETTSRVLIEAAAWDPPTVMYMSRRHGLRSEASARFERGVDPNLPPLAATRAAELMVATSGGEALAGMIDQVAVPVAPWVVSLPLRDVTRTLGDGFDPGYVASLLERLGLRAEGSDPLTVTVPTHRPDLTRAIDLVEEVARLHGYQQFGDTVPTGASGAYTPEQRRTRLLRQVLAGVGLHQAVNLSFMGGEDLDAFAYPADHPARQVVRVKNPLREEESAMRTSLLPGLLRSLRYNRSHGTESAGLFEVGKVFFHRPDPADPRIPHQPDRLGFAAMGELGGRDLAGRARPVDVYTATAIWEVVAERLGITGFELRAATAAGFHPGRCAAVVVDGRQVGFLGEVHPETVAAYELEGRVVAGELDLEPLVAPRPLRPFSEPSVFPPVTFDLAFVVDEEVPASRLLDTTRRAGGDLVEAVRVFDEFRGGSLPGGRKSLALTYTLRAPDRTLSNDEVAPVRRAMAEAAAKELGAELRGEA